MSSATKSESETHWATEAGRETARRRSERQAELEAQAQAEEGRQRMSVDLLAQRFRSLAALILELVDRFARAAGIPIDADPVTATEVRLMGHGRIDSLWLSLEDDRVRVTFRGRSRAEESSIDLGGETFELAPVAEPIARRFCKQLEAEDLYHVAR